MPEQTIENYTVVADAVNITTPEIDVQTKRHVVVRALRGENFDAPTDHPSVLTLLSMKSILPTSEYNGKQRTTTRVLLNVFRDEITPAAVEDVVPINAPAPVDADAITATR